MLAIEKPLTLITVKAWLRVVGADRRSTVKLPLTPSTDTSSTNDAAAACCV